MAGCGNGVEEVGERREGVGGAGGGEGDADIVRGGWVRKGGGGEDDAVDFPGEEAFDVAYAAGFGGGVEALKMRIWL